MDTLHALHDTLARRLRPEDIAQRVLDILGPSLARHEHRLLANAAAGSLKNKVFGYTSMLEDFARPAGAAHLVARGEQLFDLSLGLPASMYDDPESVELAVRRLGVEIRKRFGENDFRYHRLSRAARVAEGLDRSRRLYNRRFRHLVRMERKLLTMLTMERVYRFTRVGKSGLATELPFAAFGQTIDTACFIAYYVAKRQVRSEFTVSGQPRPFDEVAAMLFARCERDRSASWFAIAHVMPTGDVLARLDDAEKGELLGRWDALLVDSASYLGSLARSSRIDFRTMIVARGNDSTRWNQTAGAFNEARAHYIGLVHALGAEAILDVRCPGKVLKLIAADVAAWHRSVGHAPSAEVAVQASLPFAWDVLSGERTCTRDDVRRACIANGVEPTDKGWTVPRRRGAPVAWRPTPELVHGVQVASPALAHAMRVAGFFSGKAGNATATSPSLLAERADALSSHVQKKEEELRVRD